MKTNGEMFALFMHQTRLLSVPMRIEFRSSLYVSLSAYFSSFIVIQA